jgi:hypothetical protein
MVASKVCAASPLHYTLTATPAASLGRMIAAQNSVDQSRYAGGILFCPAASSKYHAKLASHRTFQTGHGIFGFQWSSQGPHARTSEELEEQRPAIDRTIRKSSIC